MKDSQEQAELGPPEWEPDADSQVPAPVRPTRDVLVRKPEVAAAVNSHWASRTPRPSPEVSTEKKKVLLPADWQGLELGLARGLWEELETNCRRLGHVEPANREDRGQRAYLG